MLSHKELYVAQVQMFIQDEAISWNRLYNFLMGNSILVLAWATVYASTQNSALTKIVLSAICLLGGLSGIAWSDLGERTRKHAEKHFQQAFALEQDPNAWDAGVKVALKPFTGSTEIRDGAKLYSTNQFLLKGMPLAFTLLYAVMLIATWWGRL